MKIILLFILLCTVGWDVAAQQRREWNIGVEQDVLPYITGGYFLGAWAGKGHTRIRAVMARVHKPDFIVPKGFTNNRVTALALLADYFPQRNWKGLWIGGGLVHWQQSIQADTKMATAHFNTVLLNGSMGYHFFLFRRCYVSPWVGMHIKVGGPQRVSVDQTIFKPPVFNPEGSVKLGWFF